MKKAISVFFVMLMVATSFLVFTRTASADDAKTVVGALTKIEMAGDEKSAVATLKDNKSGEDVVVFISDDTTLDKFKDKRIVEGDEIRCKFEKKDGKNVSKIFKKTAGC